MAGQPSLTSLADDALSSTDALPRGASCGEKERSLTVDLDGGGVASVENLLAAVITSRSTATAAESTSASVLAGGDPPDWTGGAFGAIYQPYARSGSVDEVLGDGTYTSRDVDLFAFDLLTESSLTFESFSQAGQPPTDTLFRFVDYAGVELGYDDDGGSEAGCSRLETGLLSGGRYYLGVSGFGNRYYDPTTPGTGSIGQTGPYRLTFTLTPPAETGGETLATATPLGHTIGEHFYYTGIHYYGALGELSPEDVDLYSFSAFRGTVFDFETQNWTSTYSPDTYLILFSANGVALASDDDGGEGTFSRISSFSAPYTGTYYVGVSGYPNALYDPTLISGRQAGSVGDYVLLASFTEWDDLADTRSMANRRGTGFAVSEKLGNNQGFGAKDVDLIELFGFVGDHFSLLTQADPLLGSQDVDTVLRLFDAEGNQVAFNDDAVGIYSRIEYTVPATGTYYLGVSGYPNSAYSLANPATTTDLVLGAVGDYLVVGSTFTETTPPTVALVSPAPDSVVADWVALAGTVYDANIFSWELRAGPTPAIQPELIASGNNNLIEGQLGLWDTSSSVPDGNYYVKLTAEDNRGNVASTVPLHLIVDNTQPIAVITSPAEGATVSCQVPIRGTAVDANFGSWWLADAATPSGPWTTIAVGTAPVVGGTFATWDSRLVANGDAYLRLVVTDQADQSQEFIRRVAVSNWPLIGDANRDCNVGAADYAIWAAQFGQIGPGLTADFDCSGSVGAGDYALWAANFGKTCPPGGPSAAAAPTRAASDSRPGLWDRVQAKAARRLQPAAVDQLLSNWTTPPTLRLPPLVGSA